jgi:hypothetical protein
MEEDVGVAVSFGSEGVGDLHPSDPKVSPLDQLVEVDAESDAHVHGGSVSAKISQSGKSGCI